MADALPIQTATIDLTKRGVVHSFAVGPADFATVQAVAVRAVSGAAANFAILRSNDNANFVALSSPVAMAAPGMTDEIPTRSFAWLGVQNNTSGATAGIWNVFVCTKSVG